MVWVILALVAGAYCGAFVYACVVAWRDTHPTKPVRRGRRYDVPVDWGEATETQ